MFGLYRDGTELRGVYYSKPEVARAACLSLGTQCDYPILMGNDPFYGGKLLHHEGVRRITDRRTRLGWRVHVGC